MWNEFSISKEELKDYLYDLIDWEALEICPQDNQDILIPYVMNDAIEYYLRFQGCKMHGTLDHLPNYLWEETRDEVLKITDVELVEHDGLHGMILRQESGNIVTVWYETVTAVADSYQYHGIGHNWRSIPGEAFLRRLVNIICVLHDKMVYAGAEFCNEEELLVASLGEFAPIVYFTPIDEEIRNWYAESEDGISAALQVADMAQNQALVAELQEYQKLFLVGKIKPKHTQHMIDLFMEPENGNFWKTIAELVRKGSCQWSARDYGDETNAYMKATRESLEQQCHKQAFLGNYPYFYYLDESGRISKEVFFVEEHPFTVLEAEDYSWKIYYMEAINGNVVKTEISKASLGV